MADGSTAKAEVSYAPLFARVLIKREVQTESGGVLIPETIAKRHARCEGVVIAKGPSADESIEIGMRVIFGRHAGTWLDANYAPVRDPQTGRPFGIADKDDGTLFLCADEDILAVVGEK